MELQTLLVENKSIFVGATNAILQFDDDLSLLKKFDTGPANDGEFCFSPLFCAEDQHLCSEGFQCTNNYNSLLLAHRDRLLACGTLHETCDLLMLNDISRRFGNMSDLQCAGAFRKITQITRRNKALPIVAAMHLDDIQSDDDLFYLGRSPDPIFVLIAPSLENSYFSNVDSAASYLHETYRSRQAIYHLAWTDDVYAYILWTDETNKQLKLTRYCHEITSTLSRTEVEIDGRQQNGIFQGIRTYTEITLQCNSNRDFSSEVVEAKFFFNTLYVLFRNASTVIIGSSTIQALNDHFNFVRSQCWNSSDSGAVSKALRGFCSPRPAFLSEWVSLS